MTVTKEGDGSSIEPNPAYAVWVKQEVVAKIMFATTSMDAWTTIEGSFPSQSSTRAMQIGYQKRNMKMGVQSQAPCQ
jgi:hypothetical protein